MIEDSLTSSKMGNVVVLVTNGWRRGHVTNMMTVVEVGGSCVLDLLGLEIEIRR